MVCTGPDSVRYACGDQGRVDGPLSGGSAIGSGRVPVVHRIGAAVVPVAARGEGRGPSNATVGAPTRRTAVRAARSPRRERLTATVGASGVSGQLESARSCHRWGMGDSQPTSTTRQVRTESATCPQTARRGRRPPTTSPQVRVAVNSDPTVLIGAPTVPGAQSSAPPSRARLHPVRRRSVPLFRSL